jgi:uncharacterized protein YjiS (DUF1127 family)
MNMSASKSERIVAPFTVSALRVIDIIRARLKQSWRNKRAESDLQTLDDAVLRDIGILRGDIPYLGGMRPPNRQFFRRG